jgi:hypothetical protein
METEPKAVSNKGIAIALGVIVVCAVIFIAVASGKKSATVTPVVNGTTGTTTTPTQTPATVPPVPPVSSGTPADTVKGAAYVYKNGTYAAIGSYMSPGGPDHLDVTLTLTKDIVTSATVTAAAGDPMSARYQAMFISGFKQYVVGKNIADVHVTKVSGSSLTGKGFNDALGQIELKAKA